MKILSYVDNMRFSPVDADTCAGVAVIGDYYSSSALDCNLKLSRFEKIFILRLMDLRETE